MQKLYSNYAVFGKKTTPHRFALYGVVNADARIGVTK